GGPEVEPEAEHPGGGGGPEERPAVGSRRGIRHEELPGRGRGAGGVRRAPPFSTAAGEAARGVPGYGSGSFFTGGRGSARVAAAAGRYRGRNHVSHARSQRDRDPSGHGAGGDRPPLSHPGGPFHV